MTVLDIESLASPAAPDAGIRRDRWGRYLLPHPTTGQEQAWTRATTLAGTLADRYGLEKWAQRNIVLGIGARQDLYAQAAACTPDDRDTLTRIVAQAEEAAASKAGANLGTALHRFTERIDAGELTVDRVPEPWRADVGAYVQAMTSAGIGVIPGWIERVVLIPDIQVAGTCDRVVNAMWPLPRIADLKTGKDVIRYGMVEIALQLAIYAHATHWWNPTTRQLEPMIPVDQERAVVMHAPVGEGKCTLIEVDIRAGWDAVQLALAVRDWRKRKDLASIITPAAPAPPAAVADPERAAWIRGRVRDLVDAGHEPDLAAIWMTDVVPAPLPAALTDPQIDALAAWCDQIERRHQIPFGATDPLYTPFVPAEPEPTPVIDPGPARAARDELARHLVDRAKAILAEFDEHEQTALIVAAGVDPKATMTADWVRNLEVLAEAVGDGGGAVQFAYGPDGPTVVPAEVAEARMIRAAGSRGEARDRAARLAKQAGRIAPRSLPQAATQPLLVALVAGGHGTPTNQENM